MKPFYRLSIFLILLISCGNSQTHQQRQAISSDINNFLPNGTITVNVMDGIKQNKRQEELLKKFQEGIQQNYEWFVDYMQTVPNGQPMPYHPNLGLTEKEYKELQGFMNDIELVSSGKTDITIINTNNIIEFKTDDEKLKLLEYVRIDLTRNVVTIGEYELPFSDTVNITDDKNALKSQWKGYTWKLEEPKDIDLNTLKDLETLRMKQYKFTIGHLDKNDKTFMLIKGQEIENGVKQVSFELPLIF
jgi:hypothetical protein